MVGQQILILLMVVRVHHGDPIFVAPSSSGRTVVFGTTNVGSNPAGASKLGVVMISIIVPTMWRYEPFCNFLSTMVELDVVGEVILINNDITKTPNHPVLQHPKLVVKNYPSNIYVNPAWNIGAEAARFEHLCFLNDDVIVDLKVFVECDRFLRDKLETERVGYISICPGLPQLTQPLVTDGTIQIVPFDKTWHGAMDWGAGSLFFVHKKYWIPIPDGIDVFCGDLWVWDSQHYLNKRRSFKIVNCFYHSPFHGTWQGDSHIEGVIEGDWKVWADIRNKYIVPVEQSEGIWCDWYY